MIEKLNNPSQTLDPAERQYLVQDSGLDSVPREKSDIPRRAAADSSGDEFPIPSGHATDLVDPVGSLNLGHLSLEDGGRSR